MSEWPINIEDEITRTQSLQSHFLIRGEFIRDKNRTVSQMSTGMAGLFKVHLISFCNYI